MSLEAKKRQVGHCLAARQGCATCCREDRRLWPLKTSYGGYLFACQACSCTMAEVEQALALTGCKGPATRSAQHDLLSGDGQLTWHSHKAKPRQQPLLARHWMQHKYKRGCCHTMGHL